jgi:hypothetical protein
MKSKTFRCAVVLIATLIGGLSVSACKTALESIPSASESGAQYYLPKELVRMKILNKERKHICNGLYQNNSRGRS